MRDEVVDRVLDKKVAMSAFRLTVAKHLLGAHPLTGLPAVVEVEAMVGWTKFGTKLLETLPLTAARSLCHTRG